jgi:single-strand DNA-binding protein
MNKVVLLGRLTHDPELRYTPSNKSVCNFKIAVNRRFSRQGEEQQADFFPIVCWEKTAEFCNNYFKKGQQVALIGRLQTRSWDDTDGKRHYITEVVADEVFFADSKKDSNIIVDTVYDNPSGQRNDTNNFYSVSEDFDLPF